MSSNHFEGDWGHVMQLLKEKWGESPANQIDIVESSDAQAASGRCEPVLDRDSLDRKPIRQSQEMLTGKQSQQDESRR